MAITVRSDPEPTKRGGLTIRSYEVDFDSSYPTGGEAWDLSADFDVIKAAVFETRGGRVFELTSKNAPASSKIKAYQQKDPAASGGADIALPEVADTTDLSTTGLKVGVVIYGKKS